jgi:AraC family L-rhamnose operon transcriptional activator RhaR
MRRIEVFPDDAYALHSDGRRLRTPVRPHAHDFCEVAVVVSGRAVHRTRHGSHDLRTGDVVAVRPGSWHEYRDVVDLDVLNIYLGQELLSGDLAWMLSYPRLTSLIFGTGDVRLRLSPPATERTRGWLEQLARCRANPEAEQPLQLRSLLGCVLAEFAGAASDAPHPGRPTTPATRAALLAMAQDPARAWTVADLAAIAQVSPSHLHHQFAEQLGTSLLGWLAQYRAEQMAVRLAAGRGSVSEIGRAVGWPDPNYAARRFRATYGMSPTEYRRRFAFTARFRAGRHGDRHRGSAGRRGTHSTDRFDTAAVLAPAERSGDRREPGGAEGREHDVLHGLERDVDQVVTRAGRVAAGEDLVRPAPQGRAQHPEQHGQHTGHPD